jgi:hypothetical protein
MGSWCGLGSFSDRRLQAVRTVGADIDVLVVSPQFDGPRERRDINPLWRLSAQADSRIEPIPCGEMQWREDTSSAMVEIAHREGQTINLEEQ